MVRVSFYQVKIPQSKFQKQPQSKTDQTGKKNEIG